MVQSQERDPLTIGGLAAAAHVGVETVRYYQRKALMRTPERQGGFRYYTGHDLRRLHFIRRAQAAGFTLEEIGELLELDASHNRARAREIARHRIDALTQKLADLERARDALVYLERQCAEDEPGPCPILSAFGV